MCQLFKLLSLVRTEYFILSAHSNTNQMTQSLLSTSDECSYLLRDCCDQEQIKITSIKFVSKFHFHFDSELIMLLITNMSQLRPDNFKFSFLHVYIITYYAFCIALNEKQL